MGWLLRHNARMDERCRMKGQEVTTGGSFYSIWTNNFYLQKVFCEFQKADEKGGNGWNGWKKWMNLKLKKKLVINWMMNKFGKT